MNLDVNIFDPWNLVVSVVPVFLGAIIGLHAKNWVPGLNLRDGLRAVSYLTRYDAALDYHGLRRRERRARVDELRANFAESASDGGLEAAIVRLGPPRTLAAEVAGARLVPSWMRGVLWLGGALAVGMVALGLSSSAFLGAFESLASPGDTATWDGFFVTLSATAGAGGGAESVGLELSLVSLATLLVPFLMGARVWRLWTGRREQHVVSDEGSGHG